MRDRWCLSLLVLFLLPLLAVGCKGSPLVYSTKERRLFIPKDMIPMRVAVANFPDLRPEEEHDRTKRTVAEGEDVGDFSDDKDFADPDIGRGLAKMTVTHLRDAGLFQDVQHVDVDRKSAEANVKGETFKGFDAVLVGDVAHFWGYLHKSLFRTIFFLPLGGSGYFIDHALKTPVKGQAQFANVKLISTKTGEVLYQGSMESGFDESQAFTGGRTDKALEAWRVSVNKVTEAIATSNIGPRVAKQGFPVTPAASGKTERFGRAR